MDPQSLDDAVETARRNLGSMTQGDAGPSIALLSQRDDVVLANPLGPPIIGFANVAAEVERVASMFVDGEPTEFDEVARWASDDLGCVVAVEHARVERSEAKSSFRRTSGSPPSSVGRAMAGVSVSVMPIVSRARRPRLPDRVPAHSSSPYVTTAGPGRSG
jgi:hypothetical protein